MFYTVKKKIKVNGKQTELNILHEGDMLPQHGEEYTGIKGKINQPIEYYVDGVRKSNETLVLEKLAEDHTGTYFDKDLKTHRIVKLGESPRESWVKEKPLPYRHWDGKKWKDNNTEKKAYEGELDAKQINDDLITELNTNLEILTSTDHEILILSEKNMIENIELSQENIDLIGTRKTAREEASRIKSLLN